MTATARRQRAGHRANRARPEADVDGSSAKLDFAAPQAHPGFDQKQDAQETRRARRKALARTPSPSRRSRRLRPAGSSEQKPKVTLKRGRGTRRSRDHQRAKPITPAPAAPRVRSQRRHRSCSPVNRCGSTAALRPKARKSPQPKQPVLAPRCHLQAFHADRSARSRGMAADCCPGESLSRHRTRQPESAAEVDAEPQGTLPTQSSKHRAGNEDYASTEHARTVRRPALRFLSMRNWSRKLSCKRACSPKSIRSRTSIPEATIAACGVVVSEPSTQREQETAEARRRITRSRRSERHEHHEDEHEGDADASHHVDPLPPSGFRLFGLGGKKKRSDDEPLSAGIDRVLRVTETEAPSKSGRHGLVVLARQRSGRRRGDRRRRVRSVRCIATTSLKSTTLMSTRRRLCRPRFAPANWARCCRKRTSITASS